MKDLTDRQRQVLDFIADFSEEHKFPPTVREIGLKFNISLRAVQDHIGALQKKGYLSQSQKRSRSIVVLKDMRPALQSIAKVPVLGTVAAGRPLLSEENIEDYISCPAPMIKPGRTYFALHVRGVSMKDAGIMDGDIAIIESCDTANEGEIVVAVLDNAITLKRFFKEANRIRLQAENPDFPPIYKQEVTVAGRLAAIIRTY